MLYHYYMKISFQFLLCAALAVGFSPCALAQVSVVKQDGAKIYLDISEFNRNVSVGDSFKIITATEKLVNPKTGKELGDVYHYSPEGRIVEVQPLYAVGELPYAAKYALGQEAVITAAVQTAPTRATATADDKVTQNATAAQPLSTRKMKKYPVLEREVISAVEADLSALPGEEIALADRAGILQLYSPEEGMLRLRAEHKLPRGQKPLALSAADLTGAGQAQLFVTVYDENKAQISTRVYEVTDHEFKPVATLPYFVKEMGCAGQKKLYAQKPFTGGSKAGDGRLLRYKNGKFSLGEKAFATRGSWLSGMNFYPVQSAQAPNVLSTLKNGRIRLTLRNGKPAESQALFAKAANRVKYKQDIISFYPSLQAYGPAGRATLAGVENVGKLGLLSEQFGQYSSSKLHFLTYENGVLDVQETLPLNGFVYDTSCTARGILVPQVVSGGQTILTEIYR